MTDFASPFGVQRTCQHFSDESVKGVIIMSAKRLISFISVLIVAAFSLSGCTSVGDKSAGIWVIYGICTLLSLFLLVGYCCAVRKKDVWFLFLFASVFIVNIGYLSLSVSKSIEEALLANRISYLGSVFLPFSMLMIILGVAGINCKKWLSGLLIVLGIVVFFIAASPGYLDIYYKEVSLRIVDGVTVLDKVYGPWHILYLFYLLGYFGTMMGTVIYAIAKKKMETPLYAVILAVAVFVNIGVWLIEQFVKVDFEILSVSYILSEVFLLSLSLLMNENLRLKELIAGNNGSISAVEEDSAEKESAVKSSAENTEITDTVQEKKEDGLEEKLEQFAFGLTLLTPAEKTVYEMYVRGKTTREIMAELGITENTLKFHNKNLYGKLGVSSRKQLMLIHGKYVSNSAD